MGDRYGGHAGCRGKTHQSARGSPLILSQLTDTSLKLFWVAHSIRTPPVKKLGSTPNHKDYLHPCTEGNHSLSQDQVYNAHVLVARPGISMNGLSDAASCVSLKD